MKKLFSLIAFLFVIPTLAFSQANGPIGQTVRFTSALPASGIGPVIDLTTTGAGITQHSFTWAVTGTVSAGAIKLQQSTTFNFASPTDCIAAQTVTSSGGPTTITSCNAPYVRLFASTAITGSGAVIVRYLGFAVGTPSTISGSVTVSQATAANLNARVLVFDAAGNGRGANVDASNNLQVITPTLTLADYSGAAGPIPVMGGFPAVVNIGTSFTGPNADFALLASGIGGGTNIAVTRLLVDTSAATSVNVGFTIGCGASSTPTGTGLISGHGGLSPGSGVSQGTGGAVIGTCTSGQALRLTNDVPTSGNLKVFLQYFTY